MPSGVASPACSAIVQQFLAAGRPATPPGTSGPALAARSGRTGRRSDRSAHRRPPTTRQERHADGGDVEVVPGLAGKLSGPWCTVRLLDRTTVACAYSR